MPPSNYSHSRRRIGCIAFGRSTARTSTALAVSLLPQPGQDFPNVPFDPTHLGDRYKVQLKPRGAQLFQGFLGDSSSQFSLDHATNILTWKEDVDAVIMSPEEILANCERDTDDPTSQQSQPDPLTLGHFLSALYDSQSNPSRVPPNPKPTEIYDQRVKVPTVSDADDSTTGVAPEGQYTPYLRRDSDYDGHVSAACRPKPNAPTKPGDQSAGLSTGLVASEILTMFRDDHVAQATNIDLSSYKIARPMRGILVFTIPSPPPDPLPTDLVSLLIETDPTTTHTLAGAPNLHLNSVDGPAVGRNYELRPGHAFQANDAIALAWDFGFAVPLMTDTIHTVYEAGFVEFRITRTNISKPRSKPRVDEVTPCWLDPRDGTLVRPQFQYVDKAVTADVGVNEGDLLQYRVEAIGQTDTPLAICLFDVLRQTVKALPPPAQAIALHIPLAKTVTGGQTDNGTIEIAVAIPQDELNFATSELKIQIRLVPIPLFGAYGFAADPDVATTPQPSLPPQANKNVGGFDDSGTPKYVPTIHFATARRGSTLPWEETYELTLPVGSTWKQIFVRTGDNAATGVGYRVHVTIDAMKAAVRKAIGLTTIPPASAVEISIGRLKKDPASTTTRSVLATCRHALVFPPRPPDPDPDNSVVASSYFGQGNDIDAARRSYRITPRPCPRNFTCTDFLTAAMIEPDKTLALLRVALRMPPEKPAPAICNPVVGYTDCIASTELDPLRYRPSENGITSTAERAFRVLPESVFRATPATIELRGMKKGDYTADWQPQPQKDTTGIWTPATPPGPVPGQFPYSHAFVGIDANGTVVTDPSRWLHNGLRDALRQLLTMFALPALGGHTVLTIAYQQRGRMDDKADTQAVHVGNLPDPTAPRTARFLAAFGPFTSGHTDSDDPYGWQAAEALGLSCEVIFQDAEGEPLSIDELVKDHQFPDKLKDVWGNSITPAVAIELFLNDDGKTYLNVVRLIHAASWVDHPNTQFDLLVAVKTAVLGRDPASRTARWNRSGHGRDYCSWLIPGPPPRSARIRRGLGDQGASNGGVAVTYRRMPVNVTPIGDAALADISITPMLPVSEDGVIEVDLPISDRLAHHYSVAAEIERRYDAAWALLQAPAPAGTVVPVPTDVFVPYKYLRSVMVDRTQLLLGHNVLATPLPGSMQAYVFAHPAEFAAMASAVNAARIQYSGQTVALQRRIADRARRGTRLHQRCKRQFCERQLDPIPDLCVRSGNCRTVAGRAETAGRTANDAGARLRSGDGNTAWNLWRRPLRLSRPAGLLRILCRCVEHRRASQQPGRPDNVCSASARYACFRRQQ